MWVKKECAKNVQLSDMMKLSAMHVHEIMIRIKWALSL